MKGRGGGGEDRGVGESRGAKGLQVTEGRPGGYGWIDGWMDGWMDRRLLSDDGNPCRVKKKKSHGLQLASRINQHQRPEVGPQLTS